MSDQISLDFTTPPRAPRFNGPDYVPERDNERVFDCMKDGAWRTLQQIHGITKDPEASISAQLRHLRKARFGGHAVEKEYLGDGLYRYRLLVNTNKPH
jgi:hypothetical protein